MYGLHFLLFCDILCTPLSISLAVQFEIAHNPQYQLSSLCPVLSESFSASPRLYLTLFSSNRSRVLGI